MNTEQIKKYAKLVAQKRELQAMLRDIDATIATYREAILLEYGEAGIQNMRVDVDGAPVCVYLRKQVWANAADGDMTKAVSALKAAGLDYLVEEKFNVHSLSAWVRERLSLQQPLPPEFDGAIAITEKYDLGVKKS